MPRYFCNYCNTVLTHDSLSVRKAHMAGKPHLRHMRDYYETVAKEIGILPADFVLTSDEGAAFQDDGKKLDQTKLLSQYTTLGVPGLTDRAHILEGLSNRPRLPVPMLLEGYPQPQPQFYHTSSDLAKILDN